MQTTWHDPKYIDAKVAVPLPLLVERFCQLGGQLHVMSFADEILSPPFQLQRGDLIYPICSGGKCRSPSLAVLLQRKEVSRYACIVAPPFGARNFIDDYLDQGALEPAIAVADSFEEFFGEPRSARFGAEQLQPGETPTTLDLARLRNLRAYFSENLYGASWRQRYAVCPRRVFITFGRNVHAVLSRLVETNHDLQGTTMVTIPLDDEISNPPAHLGLTSGSTPAYQRFSKILNPAFVPPT